MILLWIALGITVAFIAASVFASLKVAGLRRSGVYPRAGQATMADVERLVRSGQKIYAIRCYREIHDVSLVAAKKAVEELQIAA